MNLAPTPALLPGWSVFTYEQPDGTHFHRAEPNNWERGERQELIDLAYKAALTDASD